MFLKRTVPWGVWGTHSPLDLIRILVIKLRAAPGEGRRAKPGAFHIRSLKKHSFYPKFVPHMEHQARLQSRPSYIGAVPRRADGSTQLLTRAV